MLLSRFVNESPMTSSTNSLDPLFDSGPFPHFQKSLGLFRPVGQKVVPRAVFSVLLGWVPIIALVAASGLRSEVLSSLFSDFAVHARSLLAVPLLILAEGICLPRLEEIARHFVKAGLVNEQDYDNFSRRVDSTRRLMNSTLAEVIAIVGAYGIVFMLYRNSLSVTVPSWYLTLGGVRTWAGLWYCFISAPLLLILAFGWLWRLVLWGRFLFHVSNMRLVLISSHPDRASGLSFLGSSLLHFTPLSFTLGVVTAGSVANRVIYRGESLDDIKKTIIGLVIFVIILFIGPLLVFVGNLRRAKIDGIFQYGKLAGRVGQEFEGKWLARKVDDEALQAPDFSATTDLYQVVSNVYAMGAFPFGLRGLVGLAVSALLPFVPVVLMTFPLKVILKELASLLI